MSLGSALSNAVTGLNVASRAAGVVSSNLANALSEGYGRREVSMTSRLEGGVRTDGVTRLVNDGLLADRRFADAERQNASTLSSFHTSLEGLVGTPDQPQSLTAKIAKFEDSLISASSRPESVERLQLVSYRATDVATAFNDVSDGIQSMRETADRNIESMVGRLNELLDQVQDLNTRISSAQNQGKEFSSLQDHRQQAIDEISELVPVRQVPRDREAVALYTPGGAILLDGPAAELEFSATNVIMPHMTEDAGLLSGLSINGVPVKTGSENGALRGGAIAAEFEIRDELTVTAQAQLDAVARDLVERFQDPAMDPTLGATDAGLFTDVGSAFDAADEVGISGRLSLNGLVDTAGANELWRLRDGLGAATPGPLGNSDLLQGMSSAMTQARTPASGSFGGAARSASGLATGFLSQISTDRLVSDQATTFAETRQSALTELMQEDSVDSDQELQKLLLIERAYAANARVIQTVDDMMQALLGI